MATIMDRVVTVQAPTTARRGYQQQMQAQYQYQYYPNHNYNTKAIGSATIQIAQPQVVSTTNSTVTFTPSTVSWGYGDQLVIRATIRDGNNNPLPNIRVQQLIIYNASNVAVYSDTTQKTTNSSGEVQYTVNVDNIASGYVPLSGGIIEIGVLDGSTQVRIRRSGLTVTGKAVSVTVTPDRTQQPTYNYGETIRITFDMKDRAGNTVVGAYPYVRIRKDTTVIKDFGRLPNRLRGDNTYQITVNTTNFPQAGSYTIEVADNTNYSATAVPVQLDLNSLLLPMLSLVFIIGIMSTMTRSIRI